MRLFTVLILALVFFALPGQTIATTIHVPWDQPTIQAGIDAAVAGDTVLVARGTYAGDGNRDILFPGFDLVLRSESGAAMTTLDCTDYYDSHRCFHMQFGETAASLIEGFTVLNADHWDGGGGILISSAAPTIIGCEFVECCRAATCIQSEATFLNCTFRDNRRNDGAAVFCSESSDRFLGCTFIDNWAPMDIAYGGAAYIKDSDVAFVSCDFTANHGSPLGEGGAVYVHCTTVADPSPTFSGCTFNGNGGVYSGGAIRTRRASLVITDCSFSGNSAHEGGALFLEDGVSTLMGCSFRENGAHRAGGLYAANTSIDVSWCEFYGNYGYWDGGEPPTAGAVLSGSTALLLDHCTIARNDCEGVSGIYCSGVPQPAVESTIICFGLKGAAVSGTPSLACCDIFGNEGGDWVGDIADQLGVNGNFSADPLFCDASGGDLRLSSESPCVIPQLDPGCGAYVGAWGVGCGTSGVAGGRTLHSTWGLIKSVFRLPGE
jgi:hypothetical protein